ncbi:DUF6221 family protein [Streptomyces sp. NPDC001156]
MDFVQYLRDRYDEDAARASRVHDLECEFHARLGAGLLAAVAASQMLADVPGAVCDCDGPARVLREVAAKRKILDELLPDLQHADQLIEGEWGGSSSLAGDLVELLVEPYPKCGARAVFWPDAEGCEATCSWPRGHAGTKHRDEVLDEWDEDELPTARPGQ